MTTAPPPGTSIYSPSELNREAKLHLEAGFPRIWLKGEISNLARPASGHIYFSLKDNRAQIRCALFRGNARNLATRAENGQEVLVAGRLSLFEARGDYQLIADHLLDAGAGRLQQAFEALKAQLEAEGLFARESRKPLPPFPRRIGIITSRSGAALRDVLHVLGRRWPVARVRLYPTLVQGEQAAGELIRALRAAEADGFGDVLILTRGGGSLEDLWAFNDETLARTIASLSIPVISAVGHETDFTIADFVADLRAPTPSAAAEIATPDGGEVARNTGKLTQRLTRRMAGTLTQHEQALDHLQRRLDAQHPLRHLDQMGEVLARLHAQLGRIQARRLEQAERTLASLRIRLQGRNPRRQLDRATETLVQLNSRLGRAARLTHRRESQRLAATVRALEAVSPLAVLSRGYGVVRDSEGQVLTRAEDFSPGASVEILMRDFQVDARISAPPRPGDPADG